VVAGFARRPLGEAGVVSRNRFLVDKMIVWRTILGLIMASKWPARAQVGDFRITWMASRCCPIAAPTAGAIAPACRLTFMRMEAAIVHSSHTYLQSLQACGAVPPYVVLVSLIGVRGVPYSFAMGNTLFEDFPPSRTFSTQCSRSFGNLN
jgi:hypothetical protein